MTLPERTVAGHALPIIGFGTYRLTGATGTDTIVDAIHAGYRLIDSAVNYENEGAVGAAVRNSGVPRDELIVTSKLPGRHHAADQARATIEESVFRTGLDHIDLYLIHWPNPKVDRYVEAWGALIEARQRGLIRDIGVSNFLPEHLARLTAETGVAPMVNQIELHPYFPQTEALAYHREHGILTESWSPIGRANDLLSDPKIVSIANKLGISPAQTVLAWHIKVGAIPLPKASSIERQRENIDLADIELSEDDVAAITGLGFPEGRTNDQDPAVYQEF
ncbi:aldo/keto reductase [Actinoalloteichus hymeniacidonis]|uniref:Aldo/keto reductase, diketogulonate reductase n=1 Tax=Actinoalloteichus hymeniacidonis TaxID=340345 RepID=A0AAC9HRH2_9PSEU|nr:aldo/keto reductase [Actinoalloteichus hymeniacidonis]AOS64083.1 aldo/keto reductase, diketogulonate reductase [Actinoalloteichus hymeniacidonis]MBB5907854.1 diketogulonate reductase-like aldo/keto reductase [Actinoalloteichus hymeniacidonis]